MKDDERQREFDAVCANECFAHYREFEVVLGRVARAIVSGWTPHLPIGSSAPALRAGYLLTVLAERGSRVIPPRSPSPPPAVGPFFHADPVPDHCFDAAARRWGLSRGVNYARLAQLLTPPYAA